MRKIILFFTLFSLFSTFCYGEDADIKINSINYSGNLSDNTIVNINGVGLDECNELLINNITSKIIKKSDNQIQYNFGENNINTGKIKLKCSGNIILSNVFGFPYIEKINGLIRGGYNISIKGENFGNNGAVILNGGSFKKNIGNNTLITGILPGSISDNKIYIEKDGLKSNEFKLNLTLPKIDFIYSDNDFLSGTDVTIYGRDLNFYNNLKLVYGEEKNKKYKINKIDNSITFKLDYDLGEKEVYLISGGYSSNILKIENNGKQPIIKSAIKASISIKENDNKIRKEVIIIKGDNFGKNKEDTNIFNGNSSIPIYSFNENEIIIMYSESLNNNFNYYLKVNGINSNSLKIKPVIEYPSITSIAYNGVIGDKRSIKVYLFNFQKTDNIYFNGSKIVPEGCFSGMCRIEINKNNLTGIISVGRNGKINPKTKKYDISYESIPYINTITFKGDIKYGTKFEILGKNFKEASVSLSNFSGLDSNNKLDISITDGTIIGKLGKEYDINKISSISISNNLFKLYNSFKPIELESKKLYGVGMIKKIISENEEGLFKIGTNVKLLGKGFKEGDFIYIGKTKILLNIINSNNANFIIPNVSIGEYSINIENKLGFKGNTQKIIILERSNNGKITFDSKGINKKDFYTNQLYSDSVYNIELDNRIGNYYIKNIDFIINNYEENNYLGSFDLKIDGKVLDSTIVNNNGRIVFSGYYPILQNKEKIKIELIKSSKYINKGSYEINLDFDSLKLKDIDTEKYIENIGNTTFYPNNIRVLKEDGKKCIDSLNNNFNCTSFESDKTYTIKNTAPIDEKESIEKENAVTVKISKKQQILNRIDSITEKLILSKNSLSIKAQLNSYKTLRFKIQKIVDKNKNSPSKFYLEYFYNKIDLKYKKVFKQYILIR